MMNLLRLSLLFVVLLIANPLFASDGQFCAGFERGYAAGYKRASGSSLDPLTPLCPLQPLKQLNDPDSEYEQGYILGLEQGMAEGHR